MWLKTWRPPSRTICATTTGEPQRTANIAPARLTLALPPKKSASTSRLRTLRSGRIANTRPASSPARIFASVSRQSRSSTSTAPYWRFIHASIFGLRWRAAMAKSLSP